MGACSGFSTRRRRRAITIDDRDFIRGAAAWAAKTDVSTIDFGLAPDEALHRAPEFLRGLREGKISPANARLDDASIDVLHAACRLLAEPSAGGIEDPLESVRALYDFIEKITWLGTDFDERAELLATCAFAGWRMARREAVPSETNRWQSRIVETKFLLSRGRTGQADSHPEDPEMVLRFFDELFQLAENDPSAVLDQSTFLYRRLEELGPNCSHPFGSGELEYFLGETARIVGRISRELAHRKEARRWLDLAEGWFLQTENASANLAKVAYQRIALRTEERDFEAALELIPQLISTFESLGMIEDSLKTMFLQAVIFKETDRLTEAKQVFERLTSTAAKLGHKNLVAQGYVNRVQIHSFLGEADKALALARQVTPMLYELDNRVALAKLHWGLGHLLKSGHDLLGAVEEFEQSRFEFAKLGMRAEVAAVHLIMADLFLDAGQEKQAELEIRQALPLIDEYMLVPEGFAAMTLLRESLRRQRIDRAALRNLHEHFEQKKP